MNKYARVHTHRILATQIHTCIWIVSCFRLTCLMVPLSSPARYSVKLSGYQLTSTLKHGPASLYCLMAGAVQPAVQQWLSFVFCFVCFCFCFCFWFLNVHLFVVCCCFLVFGVFLKMQNQIIYLQICTIHHWMMPDHRSAHTTEGMNGNRNSHQLGFRTGEKINTADA